MEDPSIKSSKISAFVICMNEEKNIRRCLESIKWCDEIIIVDSGSTDRTLEICSQFTTNIIKHPWQGYILQKKFALSQCNYEWVLNIDADEEVSLELSKEIRSVLSSNGDRYYGYLIPRVVFYFGKWWRKGGWYPEYRLRLCKKSATTWGGEDPHEKAIVEGPIEYLRGELYHYTYEDLADHVKSLNNFSSASALTMFKRGKRHSLLNIFVNPIARFFKFYFIKKGFLEGIPGLIVAIMDAWYVFLKYAKLWELNQRSSKF